jgi:predicted phosphodiesterase
MRRVGESRGSGGRESEPIAVLSDIHGNGRALDAVLADARRRGIERFVNLGDCLYGPFDPRSAADRLLELDGLTVAGNEDRVLVEAAAGSPVSPTARFTLGRLERRHIEWLAALPRVARVDGFVLFHGTPADDAVYLLTEPRGGRLVPRPIGAVARLLEEVRADAVLCGHDHTPSVVRVDDGPTVVNPGSVGCPAYEDGVPVTHVVEIGSPDARYAIVARTAEGVRAELIAVPYDADAAADEAAESGFPDWAQWVRTGRVAVR